MSKIYTPIQIHIDNEDSDDGFFPLDLFLTLMFHPPLITWECVAMKSRVQGTYISRPMIKFTGFIQQMQHMPLSIRF